MNGQLSAVTFVASEVIANATLVIETRGQGFAEITREARQFLAQIGAKAGALLIFMRHTSASLVIQENADPDVRTDLATALEHLAPADANWVHDVEGPDDMPAHVKAMLTGVSLHVPVIAGVLALGTWQGIYVAEHRLRPHRREVLMRFFGSRA
ncbi:MAG TPA: secondary thiamine-phosphate synthase enzyme YjbQ [Xanthobacteraceae bacterium]|nr:secondary thiamine-phosphate synthase enzyme YjbQ [Xanthobacteraceae bacterium]